MHHFHRRAPSGSSVADIEPVPLEKIMNTKYVLGAALISAMLAAIAFADDPIEISDGAYSVAPVDDLTVLAELQPHPAAARASALANATVRGEGGGAVWLSNAATPRACTCDGYVVGRHQWRDLRARQRQAQTGA